MGWLTEDVLIPEVYRPVEQRYSDSSDPNEMHFCWAFLINSEEIFVQKHGFSK